MRCSLACSGVNGRISPPDVPRQAAPRSLRPLERTSKGVIDCADVLDESSNAMLLGVQTRRRGFNRCRDDFYRRKCVMVRKCARQLENFLLCTVEDSHWERGY